MGTNKIVTTLIKSTIEKITVILCVGRPSKDWNTAKRLLLVLGFYVVHRKPADVGG